MLITVLLTVLLVGVADPALRTAMILSNHHVSLGVDTISSLSMTQCATKIWPSTTDAHLQYAILARCRCVISPMVPLEETIRQDIFIHNGHIDDLNDLLWDTVNYTHPF